MKTITTEDPRLKPPSLTDLSKPWAVILFIHSDGTEHIYYTAVNRLSGNRLSAFDHEAPSIGDNARVKSVFNNIRNKAKVLGFAGSKQYR